MIKVELTRSRSPKYRLRVDDKVFYQDSKSGIPRLEIDSSTPNRFTYYLAVWHKPQNC